MPLASQFRHYCERRGNLGGPPFPHIAPCYRNGPKDKLTREKHTYFNFPSKMGTCKLSPPNCMSRSPYFRRTDVRPPRNGLPSTWRPPGAPTFILATGRRGVWGAEPPKKIKGKLMVSLESFKRIFHFTGMAHLGQIDPGQKNVLSAMLSEASYVILGDNS
jgi:hypothetical protein